MCVYDEAGYSGEMALQVDEALTSVQIPDFDSQVHTRGHQPEFLRMET